MKLIYYCICLNNINKDKGLTKDKNDLKNNTDKLPFNFREIENEATLLFKEVSNSYSEALDALNSKLF